MLTNQQRLALRCVALFLLATSVTIAQQPATDTQKETIATAGRNDVGFPQCQYCPDPEYSREALRKKYEGVVVLMVVITREGKAGNIRVTKSPGMGLDEKAIEAVSKWRFKPATYKGKPVATQVPVEVTFRLPK